MESITEKYLNYYKNTTNLKVYPREWLIRALLGPGLKSYIPSNLKGLKVLDISFGDCRNLGILNDLGMYVFGTEISDDIVELGNKTCSKHNISAELKTGWNDSIPFSDAFFDVAISSSSAYYVRQDI